MPRASKHPIKITVHGAAGEVTGSAYLVETGRARVLVDFGLFQGGARMEAKNVLPSHLQPGALAAVAFAGMQRWKWDIIPVIAGAALLGLLRWGVTFLPMLHDTIRH